MYLLRPNSLKLQRETKALKKKLYLKKQNKKNTLLLCNI